MQAISTLRLTLQPDSDGTTELFVEVTSSGFAGRSSAWFALETIATFAREVNAFPIPPDRPPRLAGGYWVKDSREPALEQEHVFVEIRPVGRRGTVAIEVRLAAPVWESDRNSVPRQLAVTFFADYAMLQQFAHAVASLAAGATDEAVLVSDVVSA